MHLRKKYRQSYYVIGLLLFLTTLLGAPRDSFAQSGSGATNVFNITNFANAANQLSFNGNATLDGAKLQLTDGGLYEDSSAWYSQPVNVSSFTSNFTFQETNAVADGLTFTIQGSRHECSGHGRGRTGLRQSRAERRA